MPVTEQRHQRIEQENHRKAFEMYFALGEKRSYRQIAQQLGVSLPTIKNWAAEFDWRRRIAERDAEVGRRMADRTLQSSVEERERNKKIIHMALMKVAKAIAEGKVKAKISDLDCLLRLQTFLDERRDEKSERPETVTDVLEELETPRLRELIEFLRERSQQVPGGDGE